MFTKPKPPILAFLKCVLLLFFLFTAICGYSQSGVAINTSGASANTSAMLDVSSTTAGMLVPRMTSAQKNSISSPATGLLVFQTDAPTGFYYYTGSVWVQLGTTTVGQNATTVYGTAVLNRTTGQTSFALIPGLTTSIVIPASGTYYVYIATDGGVQTQSVSADGFSACDIVLYIDGLAVSNGGRKRLTVLNNAGLTGNFSFWSMSLSLQLSPGTHTIAVHGASSGLSGQAGTAIGGNNSSIFQPSLTALLLKQ
ncbi:MAG TPA: hypothetical protein VFW07_06470 [Parafilimonas sp.]|nr:hypothetical protein [Parafilimonas sp.]